MQLLNVVKKIDNGKQEFQQNTFFLANYIKVNLVTWTLLRDHISDDGILEGLVVIIDYSLDDKYAIIGMGNGPTISKIKF